MKILFTEKVPCEAEAYVIFTFEEEPFACRTSIGRQMEAQLTQVEKAGKFKGRAGQCLVFSSPLGVETETVLLFGLGERGNISSLHQQILGGKLAKELARLEIKAATLLIDELDIEKHLRASWAASLVSGIKLRSYHFEKYKSETELGTDGSGLGCVTIATTAAKKAEVLLGSQGAVVDGTLLARDLMAEPANVLYPQSYADLLQNLEIPGLAVEVLGEDEMESLAMNTLLSVGRGSVRESKLVILQWQGDRQTVAPVALVGKGVTFDAGGLSIKTSTAMEEMKYDMAGSATVVGVMTALAKRKAKVNAVGVIGLVENMPSGTAIRPGDVIKSMSGKTIEVLNTDCEGRLVLADVLWYTQNRFKPIAMVNLATLTYAAMAALGSVYAGLFSNDETLGKQLIEAGEATGEILWPLPLHEEYADLIKSDVADIKNLGGRPDSSIAAEFLKHFVGEVPWAHLDICGTAWSTKDKDLFPKGPVGWGVRMLDKWIRENHEL